MGRVAPRRVCLGRYLTREVGGGKRQGGKKGGGKLRGPKKSPWARYRTGGQTTARTQQPPFFLAVAVQSQLCGPALVQYLCTRAAAALMSPDSRQAGRQAGSVLRVAAGDGRRACRIYTRRERGTGRPERVCGLAWDFIIIACVASQLVVRAEPRSTEARGWDL